MPSEITECDLCGIWDTELNAGLCNQCHQKYRPVYAKELSAWVHFKAFINKAFSRN